MENNEKESATGLLIATYIFAILGGMLGVIFGIMVFKDKKYKDSHRTLGIIGTILAIISMFIWKTMYV